MPEFKVVIPARFASTRLPGKPLADIAGKPMIQHVYERACESHAGEVVVATDDARIEAAARGFGAEVCMTASSHRSGTDRIAEVADTLSWSDDTVIVNVQGDEPCMPATLINQVADNMVTHAEAGMATLASPIVDRKLLFDPHVVKVVIDDQGFALYFSRAPIPWHRDEFVAGRETLPSGVVFLRHIGLYAYRAGFLRAFVNWPPAPLESAESLEQLRALSHGASIHVAIAIEPPGHGVDTRDDLRRAEAALRGKV